MSSADRSSSAVRNLRSLFENKEPEAPYSPDARGRSPSTLRGADVNRPISKVRASFVAVEPSGQMSTQQEMEPRLPELSRETSAGRRRGSFSMSDNKEAVEELKRTVSNESERREEDSSVKETIPESALESAGNTPMAELREDQAMGIFDQASTKLSKMTLAEDVEEEHESEETPANPDKPVTSAEEETGDMKPAELVNEKAVSGGGALPPTQEDLRPNNDIKKDAAKVNGVGGHKESQAPQVKVTSALKTPRQESTSKPAAHKPALVSTSSPSKTAAANSPSNGPKSPLSAKSTGSPSGMPNRAPLRKPSRVSLSVPTAASAARTTGTDRRDSTGSKAPAQPKAKPRETTKPVNVPSHLMAPTAASRAKYELESTSSSKPATNGSSKPSNFSASRTAAPKSTTSTKPPPRGSLAAPSRPESRTSQTSNRRAAPADGSFLERMMRPTAASASKVQDKADAKSPPRRTQSVTRKPAASKANGTAVKPMKTLGATTAASKKAEPTLMETEEESAVEQPSGQELEAAAVEEAQDALNEAKTDPAVTSGMDHQVEESKAAALDDAGSSTPLPYTNGTSESGAALEATPAFSEDPIR